jgi:DNA mismatch repair protein MSH5
MTPRAPSQRHGRDPASTHFPHTRRVSTSKALSNSRSSQPATTPVPSLRRRPREDAAVDVASRDRAVNPSITGDQSTSDHEQEEDSDVDALDEVILAVDMRDRNTVGCAYYVAKDEKLHFMEDVKCGDVETIEARK